MNSADRVRYPVRFNYTAIRKHSFPLGNSISIGARRSVKELRRYLRFRRIRCLSASARFTSCRISAGNNVSSGNAVRAVHYATRDCVHLPVRKGSDWKDVQPFYSVAPRKAKQIDDALRKRTKSLLSSIRLREYVIRISGMPGHVSPIQVSLYRARTRRKPNDTCTSMPELRFIGRFVATIGATRRRRRVSRNLYQRAKNVSSFSRSFEHSTSEIWALCCLGNIE